MRTFGYSLAGFGLGMVLTTLAFVPHGENSPLFVGALLVLIGGVLIGLARRKTNR